MSSENNMDGNKHRAKKRFGQNFLRDGNIINHIVRAITPASNDHLVEIGPGLGALSQHLISPVAKIDFIEIDTDLIPKLEAMFENQFSQYREKITLHQMDALTLELSKLVTPSSTGDNDKLRIVGNLPYNISTPLIFHLLSQITYIADMHFMLQKELVDRMAASNNNKHYGRLSIMVQYYCEVENVIDVPPEAFSPKPKVNSAVIRLVPHKTPPWHCEKPKQLEALVALAFSQRRKTVRNCLKKHVTIELIESAGIDPSLRPENIEIEKYVNLCNRLPESWQVNK